MNLNLLLIALRRKAFVTAMFTALFFNCNAQTGVAISASGGTPDSSAILDLISTEKGTLITRMSTGQRDLIASPATGLLIFNTTTKCFNIWTGAFWKQWCSECDFAPATVGNNGPVCEGETLNLTATGVPGGATFAWTGPNGFTSALQNPAIANAGSFASGSYSLKVTSNGCTATGVTTIATVKPRPQTPTPTLSVNPICSGDLTLSATNITGATYTWTGPSSFTSSQQNPVITNVTSANAGSYSVFATVNGCNSATQSVSLTVSIKAAGGTVTLIPGYTVHTYTASGTFTPQCAGNVEILVVAGGGGGGNGNPGGGGGAGGLIYNASFPVTAQVYNVTVGAGGAAQTNGNNSVFGAALLTAIGGGAGGLLAAPAGNNGAAGGSGGGGAAYGGSGAITRTGGAGTAGQGNAGGNGTVGSGALYATGGGGGAGGAGSSSGNDSQADGGIGLAYSISGNSTYYAGGGGGGRYPSAPAGNGGLGGGGNGGVVSPSIPPTAGTPNTGGGGGGASTGAAGGSGIVIIRYPN